MLVIGSTAIHVLVNQAFQFSHHAFRYSMLNQGLSRSGDIDAASAACLAAQREGGWGEGARGAKRRRRWGVSGRKPDSNCPSVNERGYP